MCDYRRGLNLWMDLLTTYTHHSELQVIRAPSLISTFYKSPQHLLSLFQAAVSSPAFPWQWLLTVENLHLHTLRFCLHSLIQNSALNWQLPGSPKFSWRQLLDADHAENNPLYYCRGMFSAPFHSNDRGADLIENSIILLLRMCMFRASLSNVRCSQSRCLATGPYAIIPTPFSNIIR
jgi:hypothetical protein